MHSIKIVVRDDGQDTFIHRFHNFGEDVYRELRELCEIDLGEIDSSKESFLIQKIRSKDLGKVTSKIQKLTAKHHFSDSFSLLRL
jgi:hypothetical protein